MPRLDHKIAEGPDLNLNHVGLEPLYYWLADRHDPERVRRREQEEIEAEVRRRVDEEVRRRVDEELRRRDLEQEELETPEHRQKNVFCLFVVIILLQ